tara:strand:+ start:16220 stop:16696 length:477 start_codon:yes stop_codon:yes gene_type:complete
MVKSPTGTEIKITSNKNYNISYGSMDKKNPKAIYMKFTSWAIPLLEDTKEYSRLIRKINKRLRAVLFVTLNDNLFEVKKTMIDLDMRDSGITYLKPTFMDCEITLFQVGHENLHSEELISEIKRMIKLIANDVFNSSSGFKFCKKKKNTIDTLANLFK